MANNEHVNKVIYGNITLIDTSDVTVTSDKLASGYTALDASGALITGTADLGGNTVWYGTCNTPSASGSGATAHGNVKQVTINGITELYTGLSIRVRFSYASGPSTSSLYLYLKLNDFEEKPIGINGSSSSLVGSGWIANAIVDFCYNGTSWVMVDSQHGSISRYGRVKLEDSSTSVSTSTALTPSALNSFAMDTVTNAPAYGSASSYSIGDRVRHGSQVFECNEDIASVGVWDDSKWDVVPALQTQIDNIWSMIYPVGSIYITTSSTSPAVLFGGTWEPFSQGRVIIGSGEGTDDNNVAQTFVLNDTGGEYEHTLITDEMPSHTHGSKTLTGTTPLSIFTGGQASSSTDGIVTQTKASNRQYETNGTSTNSWQKLTVDATHEHDSVGSDDAHNNIQPYIVCNIWRRTA